MPPIILSPEQKNIANLPKKGIVIVKGIAGSGKTIVGIHRLKYIINNIALEGDSIAYLTFNKTLISYIGQLIDDPNFNVSDNGQSTIAFSNKNNYNQHTGTVSKLMWDYYVKFLNSNNFTNIELLKDENEKLTYIKNGIKEIKKEFQNKYIPVFEPESYNFLLEEIDWIRSCRFETETEYQTCDRKGRVKYGSTIKRIPKKSEVRKLIYRLSRKYIKLIWKARKTDFLLREAIALHQIKKHRERSFEHLIIDECQDLSKLQFDFLKHLLNEKEHATATLLYDNSQSIYPNSWLGPNRPISSLGIKSHNGNTKTLKKNWRTTAEIQEAAINLIKDQPHINLEHDIEYINRSNTLPVYFKAKSIEEHNKFIVELIRSKINTFKKKNIAIISRTNYELSLLKNLLSENNIDNEIIGNQTTDFNKNKVHLYTMHSIKGLESDIVIMANLDETKFPNKHAIKQENGLLTERKLMYVAMTRAKHQLFMISSSDTPTRFINEIDPVLIKNWDNESVDLDSSENHPELAREYKKYEDLLANIAKFKEDVANGIEKEIRIERFNKLYKDLFWADDRLNNLLQNVELKSVDKKSISEIRDQVLSYLEYNNFGKYALDKMDDGDKRYKEIYEKYTKKVKAEYRRLTPEERKHIVNILILFENIDSIKNPRYIYLDMFKIMEIRIMKKFKDRIEYRTGISDVVINHMNINCWKSISEKILKSKIIKKRNEITHRITEVSKDELISFKKLLFDDALLKNILKTGFKKC